MLVGTSGSGKTTLLRMVNRLIEPTSGEILIDDKNVLTENPVELRRRIGYVIQQVGLFPHMNIAENVRVTAEIAGGWSKQKLNSRVDELLDLVGWPLASIAIVFHASYPVDNSNVSALRVRLRPIPLFCSWMSHLAHSTPLHANVCRTNCYVFSATCIKRFSSSRMTWRRHSNWATRLLSWIRGTAPDGQTS